MNPDLNKTPDPDERSFDVGIRPVETSMMTVKDVANRLNISPGAVYKAVNCGALKHYRFGAAIRVSEDQLRQYLASRTVGIPADPVLIQEFKHLSF